MKSVTLLTVLSGGCVTSAIPHPTAGNATDASLGHLLSSRANCNPPTCRDVYGSAVPEYAFQAFANGGYGGDRFIYEYNKNGVNFGDCKAVDEWPQNAKFYNNIRSVQIGWGLKCTFFERKDCVQCDGDDCQAGDGLWATPGYAPSQKYRVTPNFSDNLEAGRGSIVVDVNDWDKSTIRSFKCVKDDNAYP